MPTPYASANPELDKQIQSKISSDYWDDRKAEDLERFGGKLPKEFAYLEGAQITWKDKSMNFDDRMERFVTDPIVEQGSTEYSASLIEKGSIQAGSIGKIDPRLVKDAVTSLIVTTGIISINTNSINANTTGWVTLAITDSVDASRTLFALTEATAYEDTVAGSKHILINPALSRSHLFTKHDFSEVANIAVPTKTHLYFYGIHNDDVSAHTYKCFVRMRFIGRAAAAS